MEKTPYIGQMDKRISVYKVDLVPSAIGEPKQVDVLVARPWAHMQDGTGQVGEDGAITSVVNRSYTIRRNREIAADGRKMHIVHDGQKFRVNAMKEINRSHLVLIVEGYE